MSRVSYLDSNIAPFVGKKFHTTWGVGESEIEIAFHRQTGRFEFKIGPSYFPSVNQLGWHLLGRLDETKTDSGFRPKMLIDNETGLTLQELRSFYPGNKSQKNSCTSEPKKTRVYKKTSITGFTAREELIVSSLTDALSVFPRMVSVTELYTPLKVNYKLSYQERKQFVFKLLKNNIIFKTADNYYGLVKRLEA